MSTMWSLGLFFLILGGLNGQKLDNSITAAEVCFDGLGCFDDLPPWGGTAQRPASLMPWTPEEIGTRFLLFTQKSRYYQEITSDKTIHASNYHGIRKTRFVIPGYLDKEDEDWPQEMCKAILSWENVNCIAVEWKRGVKTLYAQAVNNSRVVAAQVASMIRFLMANYKQKADKFHIIGHSLGAHAAGDVGSQISNISRITGLDPVEPYFQDTPIGVHLDTSDAAFVDVIHTDGLPFNTNLGLGMSRPLGHVDFYPNGGELMPGCSANRGKPSDLDAIWEGRKKFDACNHVRAYDYYMESLAKPQGFVAFPCTDAGSFAEGKCFSCADGKCPLMGGSADKFPLYQGDGAKFFLNTGSSKPFGRYSYRVRLTLNGPSWPNPGIMYVALAGASDTTEEHQIHIGTMKPGRTYEAMVDAEVDVGDVTEVKFRWNNHILNPLNPKYGASTVELQRGEDMKISHFCGTENVKENAVQSVLPCQL